MAIPGFGEARHYCQDNGAGHLPRSHRHHHEAASRPSPGVDPRLRAVLRLALATAVARSLLGIVAIGACAAAVAQGADPAPARNELPRVSLPSVGLRARD